MGKFKDLTGMKFGKLTVLGKTSDYISPSGQHLTQFKCRCECGNESDVIANNLTRGNSTTCGCSRRVFNDFKIRKGYVEMFATNGKSFYIDLDDFDRVGQYAWHFKNQYVEGWVEDRDVPLHRFIMNCPDGMDVDHIGGDGTEYDNRKSNLRIATKSENSRNQKIRRDNKSGVSGVSWDKKVGKWRTRITVNKKRINLGYYSDFELAVKTRKEAEEKYFGEWSYDYSQELYKQVNESA